MSKKYIKIIAPIAGCLTAGSLVAATATTVTQTAKVANTATAKTASNSSVSNSSVDFVAGTDTSTSTTIIKNNIQIGIDNTTYQSLNSSPYILANGAIQCSFSIGYVSDKVYSINKVTIVGEKFNQEGITASSGWTIQTDESGAVLTIDDPDNPSPASIHFGSKVTDVVRASKVTVEYKVYSTVTISSESTTKGTVIGSSGKKIEGNTIAITATPNTGYTFDGWYKNDTKISGATASYTYTVDNTETVALVAKFTAISYTITYNNLKSGGSNPNPANYTIETNTIKLKDPTTTEKFVFKGWHKDSATGETVTQITKGSTGDINLYAVWANAYNVSFNMMGHGTAPSTLLIEENTAIGSKPTDPTATGYTFGGWYKEQSLTTPWNFTSDKVTTDTTLYAKWETVDYAITYHNVESAEHENPTSYTIETETFNLSDPTARVGYTFKGWYKESTFATKVTQITKGTTGAIDLYAKWDANIYSITYKDQNDEPLSGEIEQGSPTQHTYGTATALKGATKTGYTFKGWFKTSDCSGNPITEIGAKDYAENITLYAKWEANKYAITYKDQNDQEFSGTFEVTHPTEHTYDSETTLVNPVRDGYVFKGWFKDSACAGDPITKLGATEYTSAITLYAKWVKAWNVKFEMNGHGTPIEKIIIEQDSKIVEPEKPTERGYYFAGWYKDANFEHQWDFDTPVTSDVTLYARWWNRVYWIDYKDQGDNQFTGTFADNDEHPRWHIFGYESQLVNPSRKGYKFGGWYTNSECTGDPITVLNAEDFDDTITLYAKWNKDYTPAIIGGTVGGVVVAGAAAGITVYVVKKKNPKVPKKAKKK